MNLLSVEKLSKSHTEKILFKEISFGVEQGQRIALVAKNGAGKTTLLNLLAGKDTPDRGKIVFRTDLRVSFLEQDPVFLTEDTAYEALFKSENKMQKAISAYERAIEKHSEDPSAANQELLEKAMLEVDALNAWNYEAKVKQVLSSLNIKHLDQKVNSMSGGEQKRLALARVLIEEPQLLIMDEPTNHLDLDMIEWLENYFVRNDISLLVVTHDRYFLDTVCSDILELDNGNLYHYTGNYEEFIQKKAEREMLEAKEIQKAENLYRRELEWMRKSPRARTTKSKSRIKAFNTLDASLSGIKQEDELELSIKMARIGGKILEMKNVSKSYGEKKILDHFEYVFKKGERIGIVGMNGVGKTTFLNILTELEKPDTGTISVGETIVFGYYSQKGMKLPEDKRVIEVVKDVGEFIPMGDGSKLSASGLLTLFLFPPELQYTYVSKLSGGEKKRLYLLTVLMKNPNFLILDEPTNDLDLLTLATLENFLLDFKGCLIIVSHDRYFMDKLCDSLFIMEGNGKIRNFNGVYTEYRDSVLRISDLKLKEKPAPVKAKIDEAKKVKLSYKEKFELETIEKEMPELEKRKAALTEKMDSGISDHTELMKISDEIGKINADLDAKQLRWLELSERAS